MAGLALVLVMTGAPAAQAKPPTSDRNGNTTTVARTHDGRAITNEKVAKEVAAYWTTERMAKAVDLDIKSAAGTTRSSDRAQKPTGPAGTIAPVAPRISSGD